MYLIKNNKLSILSSKLSILSKKLIISSNKLSIISSKLCILVQAILVQAILVQRYSCAPNILYYIKQSNTNHTSTIQRILMNIRRIVNTRTVISLSRETAWRNTDSECPRRINKSKET